MGAEGEAWAVGAQCIPAPRSPDQTTLSAFTEQGWKEVHAGQGRMLSVL